MNTLLLDLQRLANDLQVLGAHLHLTGPLRVALLPTLVHVRKLVKAAGGTRSVAANALHMLEQAVRGGEKAVPEILREAADSLEQAQHKVEQTDEPLDHQPTD